MKLLLDTQILLWAAAQPQRLSVRAKRELTNRENELVFSAVSIWEITIKSALSREDFQVSPGVFRRALLDNGYYELPMTGAHAVTVDSLPRLHKDPFDRLLLAQAMVEGITLLTADEQLAAYRGPVRRV